MNNAEIEKGCWTGNWGLGPLDGRPPLHTRFPCSERRKTRLISPAVCDMNEMLTNVQLTLEQHGFGLHRSTYTQFFFNKHTVGPLYPQSPTHRFKLHIKNGTSSPGHMAHSVGESTILYTKSLQVWSPVGARTGGNPSVFFTSLFLFLSLSLSLSQ